MAIVKHATGTVSAVHIAEKGGTQKINGVLDAARVGMQDRQVSMLAGEAIEAFTAEQGKQAVRCSFAENITTAGIDLSRVLVLDRFIIGTTELEVTMTGVDCTLACETGDCILPGQGISLRIIKEGKIKPGDQVIHYPRIFRFKIITLSGKTAAGGTTDPGAAEIKKSLESHFAEKQRPVAIDCRHLPGMKAELKEELLSLLNAACDVIFTTGGTGVGPGDIAPDVAATVCDKVIPGIMEFIRVKYGASNPHALISRSIAGVIKQTLVFTLPGAPGAAREYMEEILKLLEHLILMAHGLGHLL